MKNTKYRAVLFDLDGTLLDTLQDLATSVNEALNSLGFPQHKIETLNIHWLWQRNTGHVQLTIRSQR